MPILLIVIRLLLMLFGGGRTLFYGGIFISDPSAILDDIGSNLPSFLLIGLAPLIGGFFLVSWIADGARPISKNDGKFEPISSRIALGSEMKIPP